MTVGFMTPSPFQELRRRKVFRVGAVYLAAAFVLLQVAELLAQGLLLPESFMPLVTALLILGFPVALILAWAFELTPEGLKREGDGAVADEGAVTSPSTAGPRLRVWLGLAVIVVLGGVYWMQRRPAPATGLARPVVTFIDSVAILPIENQTGDTAFDHVVEAIQGRIVARLLQLGVVKVSDPFSSRRYAELPIGTRQLADSLNVDKLVRAKLYADPLRLELFTSDGVAATPLWAATYTYEPADSASNPSPAVALADSFVSDYVRRSTAIRDTVSEPSNVSPEDYGLLAKGDSALDRRTAAGLAEARRAFAAAVAADSLDARAYAGLSQAHSLSLTYRYATGNTGYRDAALALAYADRAIALDSTLSEGYAARAYVSTRSAAPLPEVVPDCSRALELAPSSATPNSWCARVFNQQGDDQAALESMRLSISVDPGGAGRRIASAYSALKQGDFDLAIEQAREASRLEPDLMLPRAIEARALLALRRVADCLRMDLGPHAGIRAACLREAGRTDEAAAVVDSLEAAVRADALGDSTYTAVVRMEDLATYYAWAGDADGATEWAREAYSASPFGVEMRVVESPLFDRVRGDSRFQREVMDERERVWGRVKKAATQVR